MHQLREADAATSVMKYCRYLTLGGGVCLGPQRCALPQLRQADVATRVVKYKHVLTLGGGIF